MAGFQTGGPIMSGRYVELPIYTLGFEEFLEFCGEKAGREDDEFKNFLKFGGNARHPSLRFR